jgi:hypothetical protein
VCFNERTNDPGRGILTRDKSALRVVSAKANFVTST